jgi:hypothetical protein
MKLKRMRFSGLLLVALGALLGYLAATDRVTSLVRAQAEKTGAPGNGQQVTGVLGSPSATTTIDGRYLPNPPRRQFVFRILARSWGDSVSQMRTV